VAGVSGIRALAVQGDAVYVDAEGQYSRTQKPIDRVLALDPASGAVKWSQAGWGLANPQPPGTRVYGQQPGALAVLDPLTGRAERVISVRDRSVAPLSDGQLVYVHAGNRVAAYGIATGKVLWDRKLDSLVAAILLRERALYVATHGTSIIGGDEQTGFIYRLDAATGR
jgi:outer membrane protein assembly factor BamB